MGQGKRKAVGFTHKRSQRNENKSAARKRRKEEKKKGVDIVRIPHTIENTRIPSGTEIEDENEDEVVGTDSIDEFSDVISGKKFPKVCITTTIEAGRSSCRFAQELQSTIPYAFYKRRANWAMGKLVKHLCRKHFTSLIVVEQGVVKKRPDGLWMCALPDGPTCHFRLTNVIFRKEIEDHGANTHHFPALNLHNFTTSLGHRISRFFTSLFPQHPQIEGRKLVTFHNQRDYIFFRQHRFTFDDPTSPRLQEIGPRFSLRLITLQRGAFSKTKNEGYEYIPRAGMEKEKLKFIL